jgi:hypothetical protein
MSGIAHWPRPRRSAAPVGRAAQGWQTSLTPNMGGGLTSTVSYTDATGAVWLFPYTGAPTAPAPYTTYQTPAGLPDTISFSWAQAGPISASDGLARLNHLWNRLNNRQKRERRQAYRPAQRYIMSGPSVGGIQPPGFSFRDPTRTIGNARVDIHVYTRVAFSVP